LNKIVPSTLAYMVDIEEPPQNTEWDPDAAEAAAEGDIQMEYSCDSLCSPNTGAVAKNYL
jgi:hypothetical protein